MVNLEVDHPVVGSAGIYFSFLVWCFRTDYHDIVSRGEGTPGDEAVSTLLGCRLPSLLLFGIG